ncbi:MAG: hypothetical protein GF310_09700 [candidate division Zixibacteria bacterium]|nr:hypothetical protein [candidate division Zixibacteria bacterium]
MRNAIFLVLTVFLFQICAAHTINVPDEQPTIQAAIDAASEGDTVLISCGIYTGDGNRDINTLGKSIVITGDHDPDSVIIELEGSYQGFLIPESVGKQVILSNLTILNSTTGIECTNSSCMAENVVIENFGYRGIIALHGALVDLKECIIQQVDVSLVRTGGGIYLSHDESGLSANGCEFNSCDKGIWAFSFADDSNQVLHIELNECSLTNNKCGLYTDNSPYSYMPQCTVNNCNFEGNNYAIRVNSCADPDTHIDARYNWWGSSDGYVTADRIYDRLDDDSSAIVICSFPLDAPYPEGVPQENFFNGRIMSDTVLASNNSPYKINGYLAIDETATVTVEPRAQFYFGPGTGLFVDGDLISIGTMTDSILYTSSADTAGGDPDAGDWKGIILNNGGDDVLRHSSINYAYRSLEIDCEAPISSIVIDSCIYRDFKQIGVSLNGPIDIDLNDCIIKQVDLSSYREAKGIAIFKEQSQLSVNGCDFSNCYYGIWAISHTTDSLIVPRVEMYDCLFSNNKQGINMDGFSSSCVPRGIFNYCSFEGNNYAIRVNSCADPDTHIDARYNLWGTDTDSAAIAAKIHDHDDDPSCAYVDFMPPLLEVYICGDANTDQNVNISDAVLTINYIFIGGDPPFPLESGDTNCDEDVNVSDAVWIINFIFIGGNIPCDIDGDDMPDC